MDLSQNKLTKTEWNSIEMPVSDAEKTILKLIDDGANDVNIRSNNHTSIIQYMKLEKTTFNESYLYDKYFKTILETMVQKYKTSTGISEPFAVPQIVAKNLKMVKKADIIRIENMQVESTRDYIFEYLLLEFCENLLEKLAPTESSYTIKKQKSIQSKSNLVPVLKSYAFYLYTLIQFKKISIHHINPNVTTFVDSVIAYGRTKTNLTDIIKTSPETIEENPYLLKYDDLTLYQHQKQLFSICNQHRLQPKTTPMKLVEIMRAHKFEDKEIQDTLDDSGQGREDRLAYLEKKYGVVNPMEKIYTPKLILYMAPTGTGKTLSPIGLTRNFRVIFVCVARHVGLALAKASISIGKKIAFAFGCETASDIRLHYYAATDYTVNFKTGGIYKVDNSVGDKVEMMICDVKSYLVAMRYMLAFNKESNILTYWDEPTITMDYEDHELHETIHKNWAENRISKMVLSCATLPKEDEIADTIMDFKMRFDGAEIHTIESYDCKKTITILNKDGKCVVPHLLFANYDDLMKCVNHCENNKSLLRYFDLQEIIKFLVYINQHPGAIPDAYKIDTYFDGNISNITMHSIKLYYLECIRKMCGNLWNSEIFKQLVSTQPLNNVFQKIHSVDVAPKKSSEPIVRSNSVAQGTKGQGTQGQGTQGQGGATAGIMITTTDAHSLTDGPTIYLAEDIRKIGLFCLQQTKIPEKILSGLLDKIEHNNKIQRDLDKLDKQLEDKLGKEIDKEKKMEREQFSGEVRNVMNSINALRGQIHNVEMDQVYIPNTKAHQQFWTKSQDPVKNAFVPKITESVVKEIMMTNVDTQMKMLLLLGVGMFDKTTDIQYMEIMKRLADSQKLFVIIASSDYIYGTNYQFCHGFIGKDLKNMTQQKIIQAMGRIGRNNIQQDYSVRFRDDAILESLFMPPEENREALIMSKLFTTDV